MTKKTVPADVAQSVGDQMIAADESAELQRLIQIKRGSEPPALAWVLLKLASPSPEVRARAADALAEIGEAAHGEVALGLTALLDDAAATVRYSAVQALGALHGKAATIKIIELLQADGDGMVQVAAAEALGYLDDAAAVPALLSALNRADAVVRRFAACAIGLLLRPEDVHRFHDAVFQSEKREADPVVKLELLIASYRAGDRNAKSRLSELLWQTSGLAASDVTAALNGIQFLIEYRPPAALYADAGFFGDVVRQLAHDFPATQHQAENLIDLLAALDSSRSPTRPGPASR